MLWTWCSHECKSVERNYKPDYDKRDSNSTNWTKPLGTWWNIHDSAWRRLLHENYSSFCVGSDVRRREDGASSCHLWTLSYRQESEIQGRLWRGCCGRGAVMNANRSSETTSLTTTKETATQPTGLNHSVLGETFTIRLDEDCFTKIIHPSALGLM